MLKTLTEAPVAAPATFSEAESPPLAPTSFAEMIGEAELLLDLMQSEPLNAVAMHARSLASAAHASGAWEIVEAAEAVQRIASGGGAVVLTPSLQALANAIVAAKVAGANA